MRRDFNRLINCKLDQIIDDSRLLVAPMLVWEVTDCNEDGKQSQPNYDMPAMYVSYCFVFRAHFCSLFGVQAPTMMIKSHSTYYLYYDEDYSSRRDGFIFNLRILSSPRSQAAIMTNINLGLDQGNTRIQGVQRR